MGILLFLQIDLLMTNLLIGAEATGQYAAILQFHYYYAHSQEHWRLCLPQRLRKFLLNQDEEGLIQYAASAIKWERIICRVSSRSARRTCRSTHALWLGPAFEELKWLLTFHLLIYA
ncbi:hypothetical protein ACEQPO_25485 [Bacillus sp. SL00103]